jgi:ERCC4-type nuclease
VDRVTVIVDTREQLAYTFDPDRIDVVRRALPAGDYSLAGEEHRVAVERKSLEDLVSTLIRGRDRFRRELRLLAGYEHACVVVEAELREVLLGRFRSGAHPHAILGAVLSIAIDHGIPVFFCSDRQCARAFVEGYLLRIQERGGHGCPRPSPPASR